MDHTQPYSDAYLQGILKSVNSIAMVGASPDKTKFSYGVLRVLNETGYDMIPVNPRPGLNEIRGIKVFPSLSSIDRPVDMVEVFRRPEDLMDMGICDRIIEEPLGGAHRELDEMAITLKKVLLEEISNLKDVDPNSFLERRINRYEKMGVYTEY